MTYIRSFNRFILISLALLGMSMPMSAHATIFTYDYTGQTYDFTANTPYNSTITITASLSFDLTTILNLPSSDRKADLTSYTVFDGVQVLTAANSTVAEATFGTDPTGAITSWEMRWLFGPGTAYTGMRSSNGCYDFVVNVNGAGQVLDACSNQGLGTFTGPSAVPVPAAIWLFGTALIGLIGVGKRKKAA